MNGYTDNEMDVPEAGADKEPSPDKNEEQSGKKSALLPKSLFPHMPNPGDECVFKVVHVYDDEVEVEYAPKEKSEPGNDDTMTRMQQYADKE